MSKYIKLEDAIKAIEEMQNCYNGWSDTYDKAQIIGVLDELPTIEVSEDCISREDLLQQINLDAYGNEGQYGDEWKFLDTIENMPRVIPTTEQYSMVGEWYRQTTDYFDYWECSECGMGIGLDDIKNFCPKCGAKMNMEKADGRYEPRGDDIIVRSNLYPFRVVEADLPTEEVSKGDYLKREKVIDLLSDLLQGLGCDDDDIYDIVRAFEDMSG